MKIGRENRPKDIYDVGMNCDQVASQLTARWSGPFRPPQPAAGCGGHENYRIVVCVLLSMAELRGSIEAMPGLRSALSLPSHDQSRHIYYFRSWFGADQWHLLEGDVAGIAGAPLHGMLMQQQGCNNR